MIASLLSKRWSRSTGLARLLSSAPKAVREVEHNWRVMATLAQHVWPQSNTADDVHRKQRVVASLGLMLGGKALTIQVPYVFKGLVDALPGITADPTGTLPVALLLGYGISRAAATGLQEWRNVVFSVVAQDAIRKVGVSVFNHVHRLDLQFHLSRNTGQLSRILDRGQRSISFVLNAIVFNVAPTILEVSLVTGLFWYQFGPAHAAIVLGTVGGYTGFTFAVTSWYVFVRMHAYSLILRALLGELNFVVK